MVITATENNMSEIQKGEKNKNEATAAQTFTSTPDDDRNDFDDDYERDGDEAALSGDDQDKTEKTTFLSYREAKEKKRLEANRIRARDRRKRDKAVWNQMQQKIVVLSQENHELKQRNQMLEAELGRMYRRRSAGAGSVHAHRDGHMRGMMSPPMDGHGGMSTPMDAHRPPPMSHMDVGYDMPGPGRPGMGDMAGPGYGSYGDYGGRGRFMGQGWPV